MNALSSGLHLEKLHLLANKQWAQSLTFLPFSLAHVVPHRSMSAFQGQSHGQDELPINSEWGSRERPSSRAHGAPILHGKQRRSLSLSSLSASFLLARFLFLSVNSPCKSGTWNQGGAEDSARFLSRIPVSCNAPEILASRR